MSRVVVLGPGIAGPKDRRLGQEVAPGWRHGDRRVPNAEYNWIPSNIWVPVSERHGVELLQASATEIHPDLALHPHRSHDEADDPAPLLSHTGTSAPVRHREGGATVKAMTTRQFESTGTYFVLPPHHRLFAVFEDPDVGSKMAGELRAAASTNDVWTFYGAKGMESIDPGVGRHGVPVAVARVLQRLMTNDCEYCDGLATALGRGAMVVAVRVERHEVEEVSARLHARGAHSLAYGEHWNFVPLRGEEHTVGFFGAEEPGAPGAAEPGAPGAAEPEAAEPGSGAA